MAALDGASAIAGPMLGISDAAEMFSVTPRSLRYYESIGLIRASRDERGGRIYDNAARERLAWIVQLRRSGVSVSAIRRVLSLGEGPARTAAAARHLERREAELLFDLTNVRAARAWVLDEA